MNTPRKPVNERTASANEESESSVGDMPRHPRVAALLNGAAYLAALVLSAATSGPKLPKNSGD